MCLIVVPRYIEKIIFTSSYAFKKCIYGEKNEVIRLLPKDFWLIYNIKQYNYYRQKRDKIIIY